MYKGRIIDIRPLYVYTTDLNSRDQDFQTLNNILSNQNSFLLKIKLFLQDNESNNYEIVLKIASYQKILHKTLIRDVIYG